MLGYPRRFLTVFWSVLAALCVSGLLLVPGAFELRWEMEVPVSLPAGWRIGAAAAHALCAFLVLVLIGALYSVHMRRGWHRSENVRTGLTTVGTFAALALTALGVYYIADEQWSRWSSALHIALSVLAAVIVGAHVVIGRRLRSAARVREVRSQSHAELPTPAFGRQPSRKQAFHVIENTDGNAEAGERLPARSIPPIPRHRSGR